MIEREDDDLLRAIVGQDPDALVALSHRYGKLAFGLAYRILNDAPTAEEVVQDAFMSVWRQAASFDTSRGSVRTWLLSIVHHRAIDLLRGRYGKSQGDIDLDVVERTLAIPDIWNEVLHGLEREQIRSAMKTLPEEQRQAIEWAYFGGFTQSEIAERTGIPLGTVKSRLRSGLQKLRAVLLAAGVQGDDHAIREQ